MTAQPYGRPGARKKRKKTSRSADAATTVLALIVALALFEASPMAVAALIAVTGTASIAFVQWPRRRPLPVPRHLDTFQRLTPAGFEQAIAQLALASGARTAHVTGGANDRGLDVLVTLKDRRRILIQCKRYAGSVGSEHVQIVNGTYRHIHGCDLAIIVTTGTFTAAARDTRDMIGREIRLVDGAGLVHWANGGRAPWQ